MTADLVLVCGTARIPASRFCCVLHSGLLKNVLSEPTVHAETDDTGRYVISVPYQDAAALQTCVALMHDTLSVRDLRLKDLEHAEATVRCLQYLDCSPRLFTAVVAKAWEMVDAEHLHDDLFFDPEDSDFMIDTFLSCPVTQKTVLEDTFEARPSWTYFKRVIKAIGEVDGGRLLRSLASLLMTHLGKVFPPHCVLFAILDNSHIDTPTSPHYDCTKVFELAGMHGSLYHPREMVPVLHRVRQACQDNSAIPAVVPRFMLAISSALGTYTPAPHAAANIHGSIVEFHEPTTSALAIIDAYEHHMRKKLAHWLTLSLSRLTGSIDLTFTLAGIDQIARRARSCEVRVMVFGPDGSELLGEEWFVYDTINPENPTRLLDGKRKFSGGRWDPAFFAAAMATERLKFIRADFFYAKDSVFERLIV